MLTFVPPAPSPEAASDPTSALALLAAAARPLLPLRALEPGVYARSHADFEACSDQRARLTRWLTDRVLARPSGSLQVLSVGCGDGSVDAPLAAAASTPGRTVHWVGLDPFEPVTARFRERLAGLGRTGLTVGTRASTFAEAADLEPGTFDVVTFVHSLYYVADLRAALVDALALLAPGGEVVVLAAPRAGLNELAGALAPDNDGGHAQWWAEDVRACVAELVRTGQTAAVHDRLVSALDLTGCSDEVLDFTVQAQLPATLRPAVRAVLAEQARHDDGHVLDHVLDSWVLTAP